MLPSQKPNRISLILSLFILTLAGAWALLSSYVLPSLIRSAYEGRSWPFFNRLITRQASHPLAYYLAAGRQLSSNGFLALGVGGFLLVLLVRPEFQIRLGQGAPPPLAGVPKKPNEPGRSPSHPYPARSSCIPWIFGAIFTIAVLLRVIFLNTKSLFEDEFASRAFALASWRHLWKIVSDREANMSLYYTFLHVWLRLDLGTHAISLRVPSILFSLGTLLAIYALGSRLFDSRAGLLAAFLLAINGFDIEFSQDARAYTLLIFLVTLSSLLFLKCVERGAPRDWLGYIAVSSLAVYAQLFAILVLLSQFTSLLLLPRARTAWRRWFAAGTIIAILDLPMMLFVLFRNRGQLSWITPMTLISLPRSLYRLVAHLAGTADFADVWAKGSLILVILYLSMLIALALAVASKSSAPVSAQRFRLIFLFIWLTLPICITVGFSLLVTPSFAIRYLTICLPPFLLLGAFCLSRIHRNWVLAGALMMIAGCTAQGLALYYRSAGLENWRAATRYVLNHTKHGDAVILSPPYLAGEFTYYWRRLSGKPGAHPNILDRDLNHAPLGLVATLPHRYKRIWLICKLPPSAGTEGVKRYPSEVKLETEFPHMQTTDFSWLRLALNTK